MFRPLVNIPNEQIEFEKRLQNLGTPLLILVTLIFLGLLVALAPSQNQWAKDTGEWWTFVSTAFTVAGGTIGLWFVWLKFIRTRGFAAKLDVTLTAGKVFLNDTDGMLHWCGVRMENKGMVSVDYTVEVTPTRHLGTIASVDPNLSPLVTAADGETAKVDVGTSVYEHYITTIKLGDAQAVTFQVSVKQGRHIWSGCITQSNLKEQPAAK